MTDLIRSSRLFLRRWLAPAAAVVTALSPATAAEEKAAVMIGIMKSVPPYVLETPSAGIEVEIIATAFAEAGITAGFLHVSLARLEGLLADRLVDASVSLQPQPACIASKAFNHWHDGLVVSAPYADRIKAPADLKGRRFAIFPKAADVLGDRLSPLDLAAEKPIVATAHHMALRLLVRDRIVAYIGDVWALDHLWFTLYGREIDTRPYKVAVEFPPSPHFLCFNDATLRDRFDAGLARIETDGRHGAIIARYRNGG